MKRKLLITFQILPWLVLGAVAYWLFLAGGLRDFLEVLQHRRAEAVFFDWETPSAIQGTSVEIYRLSGAPEEQTAATFSLSSDSKVSWPVFGKITVEGKELRAFEDIWVKQRTGYGGGYFCHGPPYGFRMFSGETLIAETTICWKCQNMRVAGAGPFEGFYNAFDVNHPAAQTLLDFCDQRLPYYRPPEKPKDPPVPKPEKIPDAPAGEPR